MIASSHLSCELRPQRNLATSCSHAQPKSSGVVRERGKRLKSCRSKPSMLRFARLQQRGGAKQCASGACEASPAERAHEPPRGVERYSASRGDLKSSNQVAARAGQPGRPCRG